MRTDRFTDQLSAFLDGELDARSRERLERHLEACAGCRATLADLRAIVAAAPGYDGTGPARDLWPAIRGRLGEAEVVELPVSRSVVPPAGAEPRRRGFRVSLPGLIAASLIMAALGAGGAWLALRESASPRQVAETAPGPETIGLPGVTPVPAAVAETEERYDAAVADLERVLAAGRNRLDTSTVRVIDESLRRIDVAIREAREAIQRDSANAYLSRQVTANLRRKLNLLRTAAKAIAES